MGGRGKVPGLFLLRLMGVARKAVRDLGEI